MAIHYCIQLLWEIFLALNVASSVFILVASLWKVPWCNFPYYVLTNDTWGIIGYYKSKIEWLSYWYWLYCNFREIKQKKVYFLLWYIELWWQSFIRYVIFANSESVISCYLSHSCLEQLMNFINIDCQYLSIPTLEVTPFPLHKRS